MQEERNYTNSQLKVRDEKIDELYSKFRELEQKYGELAQEKREVEWQLKRKTAEAEMWKKESEKWQGIAGDLEKKVDRLEKELIFTKGG
ncbi:hypothetical protein CHCC15091_0939 [Bacillus licheniformis]|nr:hypothetical protein CHCC15091_0939 [Bacillus licheniformis]